MIKDIYSLSPIFLTGFSQLTITLLILFMVFVWFLPVVFLCIGGPVVSISTLQSTVDLLIYDR